jgi:tetratricopeptide (TPR) repeat protein
VSVDLFERYKEALRRGHMALARGQFDVALSAYREAVNIAPDRALPHASIGHALLRRGDNANALSAFNAALLRSPRDEGALRGRADTLARLGRRTDAAAALDLLSDVQEAAGRLDDASDTARQALDLAEQKSRRRRIADLTRRVRLAASGEADDLATTLKPLDIGAPAARTEERGASAAIDEAESDAALGADAGLTEGAEPVTGVEAGETETGLGADSGVASELELQPGPGGVAFPIEADQPADAAAVQTEQSDDERSTEGQAAGEEVPTEPVAEPEAEPEPEPEPEPAPPPDPVAMAVEAEQLLDAGDTAGAKDRYLAAAAEFEREGLTAAALDACYVALAFAPDDAELHLRLVELYLAAGWTGPAADKLALLGRLTELDERQRGARARIVGLAADHFPDDPRLRNLTAAP